MPMTRRAALTAAALALTACSTSPVIEGEPALPPSPPKRSPEAEAAHVSVAELAALLGALSASSQWPQQPWSVAALAQCEAHLERLALPDPLSQGDQRPFEVSTEPTAAISSPEEGALRLSTAIDVAAKALELAATGADSELRLLYASAAAAVVGLRDRTVAPVPGDATPRRLQDVGMTPALEVALQHSWALVYGLGVGLGRLDRNDPLRSAGSARLDDVRALRNELRAALRTDLPQPAAFTLATAMDTPEAIRAGWADLEMNLLGGYARLVAADPRPRWRELMRDQVPPSQAFGATIPYWPGWHA